MRASLVGLVVLLLVALSRTDNYYENEYNYEDPYEYDNGGSDTGERAGGVDEHFEYPVETHDYPDALPKNSRSRDREASSKRTRNFDIPTYQEVNGQEYSSGGQTLPEIPPDGNICAQICSASEDDNVVYLPGKQYRYQYHGEVISKSRAIMGEESRLSVRAYAIITARTLCDLKLQVVNMAVDDVPTEASQWFRDAVQKYDLHFSYKNGVVNSICPNKDEDVAATNFKRGILSAMQAKVTNKEKADVMVLEADVLGECKTEYQINEPHDLVINKTKHNCRYNNYLPYIPSEHYSQKGLNNKHPLLPSKQSCQMHLRDRVWDRVECVDEMQMKELKDLFTSSPSSSSPDSSSASVSITTNLVLEGSPEDAREEFNKDGPLKRRETLRMDLEGAIRSADSYEHENTNVLEEVIGTMEHLVTAMKSDSGMQDKRPYMFSNLVTLINQVKTEAELDEIYGTFDQQPASRNIILDAVGHCERHVCVKLMARLATEAPEAIPKTRAQVWLTGVHFQTNPQPESIAYLMALANNVEALKEQAVMAASSIVHTLCQNDREICRQYAQPLFDFAKENIGEACGYGQSLEERGLAKLSLRALSNAGILPDAHLPEKCYMNKLMNYDIREAAFQTYRRVDCDELDLETPWKVLEDGTEDVGVRITAYKSLVRCAANVPSFFSRVELLLRNEEVNQVGSYIWTHVRNLATTPEVNPYNRELSQLARQHTLKAIFNNNAFRTSRNYRMAQFSQLLNLGSSMDSDLIFTPDSYVPRQESHKIRIDFLENSIDFLEAGYDYKGLDQYLESLFGDQGYFENENIKQVLEILRPKRDIHDEKIQDFQMLYDEARTRNEIDDAEKDAAKGGFFFRVFGNEIFYLEDLLKPDYGMYIQQLLREFSVPKSFQILKQEFVSPTVLGFPLRMRLNATGTVTYDYNGNFKMNSLQNMNLEGQVSASASLAIDEMVMIDAYGASSGIRGRSSQVLNVDFGGKLAVKNGKVVDIQIQLPSNEIAHVSSSVKVALYQNYQQGWVEKGFDGDDAEKPEDCTREGVTGMLGLELCFTSAIATVSQDSDDITYSDMHSSKFTLTKADTFSLYQFHLKNQGSGFEVLFDTPGSSVDRKVQLQFNMRQDRAQGMLSIPGKKYDFEGQYEISESMKKVALMYREDSDVLGEIEFSLPMNIKRTEVMFKPRFVLKLKDIFELELDGNFKASPDTFALEANAACSLHAEPLNIKATWGRTGEQHKVEAGVHLGIFFGSVTSTLFLNGEKTLFQVDAEYGKDTRQPNTITLTFDRSLVIEEEDIRYTGYLSLESSVGKTNVELEYDYGADFARAATNITVLETQVSSHVSLRNVHTSKENDFEISLSLTSNKLDIDYKGKVIYKATTNALHTEVEVILSPLVTTKAALTYHYDNDPFHVLGGFQFSFNDYVIQFSHEIDWSQAGRLQIISSDIIGPAAGALKFEANYDKNAPFNATLDVHAGYDNRKFGFAAKTLSCAAWDTFEGSMDVTWFDQAYSVQHKLASSDQFKNVNITLTSGGGTSLDFVMQLDPDFVFQFSVQLDKREDHPDFKIGAEKRTEGEVTTYETYLISQGDDLFHLSAADTGDNHYSGKAKFLRSEVDISGQVNVDETTEASVQATITLPSGETFSPQIAITHKYDGVKRNIKVSAQYGGEVIATELMFMNRDGWFSDDTNKFSLSFVSPFEGLKEVGLAYETHSDWYEPWFAEVQWDDFKIRGDVTFDELSNMEAKLQYEDGGSCDSHIHFYNKYDGEQYRTGASVGITKSDDPWAVEIITKTTDSRDSGQTVDIALSAHSPFSQTPFEVKAIHSLSNTQIGFEFEAGLESKTKFSFLCNTKSLSKMQQVSGAMKFDSPWTDPMSLNVENYRSSGFFNVTLDLKTSLDPIYNVGSDFSMNYSLPGQVSSQFYLSHQDMPITLEMLHKLSESGLKQRLEGSVNLVIINYDLDVNWGENLVPQTSNAKFSVNGMVSHNFEIGITHDTAGNRFETQLSGSWDWRQFSATHLLEYDDPLKWRSSIKIQLPDDKVASAELFFNSQEDLSSLESTFHFSSSWTEGFTANFEIHGGSASAEYNLEATYGDVMLFKTLLLLNSPFQCDKADFSLEVSSSFFDASKFSWEHDFSSGHLLGLELAHGEDFHFLVKSHLNYKQGFFSQEYEGYSFNFNLTIPYPELGVKVGITLVDVLQGELEVVFTEYTLQLKSSVSDGKVFVGSLSYPGEYFQAQLLHETKLSNIPDLSFSFAQNDIELLRMKGEFTETFPKFDAVFSLYHFDEYSGIPKNGRLQITADFSDIENFALKGMVKLTSDFKGFESYWAEIDTGFNFDEKIKGHINGQVHVADWHFKTELSGLIDLGGNFKVEYSSKYEINYGNTLYDKKELHLKYFHSRDDNMEGQLTTLPQKNSPLWSIVFSFNKEETEFKGYVIPGNSKKYDLALNISENVVDINAHIENEDGTQFDVLVGNVNWNIRKLKKHITMDFVSDYKAIKKVTGLFIIQQRKGLSANVKVRVNQDEFTSLIRYVNKGQNAGKIMIKAENQIYVPFTTNTSIQFDLKPDEITTDLDIELDGQENWLKASLKGSLSESHLRFNLPFEGLDEFDLTVTFETEDRYGIKVALTGSLVCFDLSASLNHFLDAGSLITKLDLECTGDPLFDFSFKYNSAERKAPFLATSLSVKGVGKLFNFEVRGFLDLVESDLEIETEVYPYYHHLASLAWSSKDKAFSFQIKVEDKQSQSVLFLYKQYLSERKFELDIEVRGTEKISIKSEHNIQSERQITLDGSYSHNVIGYSFNAKLTLDANINHDAGSLEAHLSTDATFDHADFTISYDTTENRNGKFSLATTNGNAEGKVTFEDAGNGFTFKAEMQSDLHRFKNYLLEVHSEKLDNGRKLYIKGKQDDIEYELSWSKESGDGMNTMNIEAKLPFEKLQSFDISVGYTDQDLPQSSYEAKVGFTLSKDYFEISGKHTHDQSWKKQESKVSLLSPLRVFGNYEVSFSFDLDGQSSFYFENFKGKFVLLGSWGTEKQNVALTLKADLSVFKLGEYELQCEIPLKLYQKALVKFSHHLNDYAVTAEFKLAHNYEEGLLNVGISPPGADETTYEISYEYKKNLKIHGKWNEWDVNGKASFTGKKTPLLSGTFEVNTDFEGFESISGSWDFQYKKQEYTADLTVDIDQRGSTKLFASFSPQAQRASEPWQIVNMDVKFESFFTKTHKINAQYNLLDMSMTATYQYGTETFKVSYSSSLADVSGSISLYGNLPFNFVSTFNLDLKYDFENSLNLALMMHVEDTFLDVNFEVDSGLNTGHSRCSWSSPFTNPMDIILKWSADTIPLKFEASWEFGKQKVGLNMEMEYSDASANMNVTLMALSTEAQFNLMYDFSTPNDMKFLASVNIGPVFVKFEVDQTIRSNDYALKAVFSVGLNDISASLTLDFGKSDEKYSVKITDSYQGSECSLFTFDLTDKDIQSSFKYENVDVFALSIGFKKADISFKWKDFFIHLIAQYKSKNNGHQIDITLESSETRPLSLQGTYSGKGKYEASMQVTYGDKEFNLNGNMEFKTGKASLEFNFDSSEDPYYPIKISAMYDLSEFIQGKMKSDADLASLAFEWGEKLEIAIRGQRRGKSLKLNVDMVTPFKMLPEFHFGCEGEFINKGASTIDLTFSSFIEWSKKVTLTGLFKLKNEKLNLKLALTTPFSRLENLVVTLQHEEKHIEASIVYNGDEWEAVADYEFSPNFSCSLNVKTPIPEFEDISLTISAEANKKKFNGKAKLTWGEENAIEVKARAEKWYLEIYLDTPWEPLKDASLITSLRTESEELMIEFAMKWSLTTADLSLAFSPVRFKFMGKYVVDNNEIGVATFEYKVHREALEFNTKIETPFETFSSFEVAFLLGFKEGQVKFNLSSCFELSFSGEAKNYWTDANFEGSFSCPYIKTPITFQLKYEVDPKSYSLLGMVEVVSDVTWFSGKIDFINDMKVEANIFDGLIEFRLSKVGGKEFELEIDLVPIDGDLEFLKLQTSVKYGPNFKNLDVSAVISSKVRSSGETFTDEVTFQYKNEKVKASLNFSFNFSFLERPYEVNITLPLVNIFTNDGKLEVAVVSDGEELYKLYYEMSYPQPMTFTHVITVHSTQWTAEISASLTKSNFQVSLSFPDEDTKHAVVLSWPREISLEKLALQLEVSSPLLKEGDLNLLFDFSVQQKFYFTLTSSLTYGSRSIETSSKFQYSKKERKLVIDATITSEWIGNHSANLNIKWMRNINVNFHLNSMNLDHSLELQIDREEYTMQFDINSPWLSVEGLKMTGTVNKDMEIDNIMIEGKLELNEVDYSVEIKSQRRDENIDFHLTVKGGNEIYINLSGVLEYSESIKDVTLQAQSDVVDIDSSLKFRYEDSEEMRSLQLNLYGDNYYNEIFNLKLRNSKIWSEEQSFTIIVSDLFTFIFKVTFGTSAGEVEMRIRTTSTKTDFRIDYDFTEEFSLVVHIQTPFEILEIFEFELGWTTTRARKELDMLYGWHGDIISFNLHLIPDGITGYSVGACLKTPFPGYEVFRLQTPQFVSPDIYNILIEYPGVKTGLWYHQVCKGNKCELIFTLELPLEDYEIISLKFGEMFGSEIGFEFRVGKVGVTLILSHENNAAYYETKILVRINEYKTEAYLRYYKLRNRHRLIFHTDAELHDILDLKSLDLEYRYDPSERLLISAKKNDDDIAKLHFGWGTDKVIAITTPKVYPGYVILNLESSSYKNDYQVQIGLSKGFLHPWDVYGFHIRHEQLGFGRDVHVSGEAGKYQFAVDGTITLNPFYDGDFYFNDRLTLRLNQDELGFVTFMHVDSGFIEDDFSSVFEMIVPSQTVHLATNASCSSRNFNLLSKFKWDERNDEEKPIVFTLNYDDISSTGEEHTLKAVFDHPKIQNLTLWGNLTRQEDAPLYIVAEFEDENDSQRNILFRLSSSPGSQPNECVIHANISQPSSNFAAEFDADILESFLNTATYRLRYYSLHDQKWEDLSLATNVDSDENGWHYTLNMSKLDSNWGYNYKGSLLNFESSAGFSISGASVPFMDSWSFEGSVNKYLPELEMQLQAGRDLEEPYEIGRIRVGLHNPLEIGAIVDHERFGVWRQDAKVGLRLLNQDILQFVLEFDPTFDFADKSVISRMVSPASKISRAWHRDLSYTASALKTWASSEIPQAIDILFNQDSYLTVCDHEAGNFVSLKDNLISYFSTIFEDLSNTWTETIGPMIESSFNNISEMWMDLSVSSVDFENMAYFWNELTETVNIALVRFHDHVVMDMDRFYIWWSGSSQEMTIALKNMMYKLVRFMNALFGALGDTMYPIQQTLRPTFIRIQRAFIRYEQDLRATFVGRCWPVVQQQADVLINSLARVQYSVTRFFQPEAYGQIFQNFGDWLMRSCQHVKETFDDGISQLEEAITESAMFEVLMGEFKKVGNVLSEGFRDGFYVMFQRRFTDLGPRIMGTGKQLIRLLKEKYHDMQQLTDGNIVFDYIDAITGSVIDRLFDTWKNWTSEQYHVLDKFQRIFVILVDIFKKVVEGEESLVEKSIIFEPKTHGRIVYNQHLPVPWNSFLEAPQLHRLVSLFQEDSPVLKSKRKLKEGLDHVYSVFDALSLPGSTLPPFTATATVFGQQITTFDLFHYQFLGSCSYLMAKDFVGGDFEIIGEYDRSDYGEISLESMVIRAQDIDVTLYVNGTMDIRNQGSAEVYTSNDYAGFKLDTLLVTCNSNSRGCSVTVGSKYFGRLAGLFGNYNYEPSDDSNGPDGSKAKSGEDIANNWAVNTGTCYLANQVLPLKKVYNIKNFGNCHELYLSDGSPFSRCFMVIDPRPYFWHCVRDMNRVDFGKEDLRTPCGSATAYRTQCANRGIHMQPLNECSRKEDVDGDASADVEEQPAKKKVSRPRLSKVTETCDVSGETVPVGWATTYEDVIQGSADLAFIIELANCNKDRNLQLLLRLIKVQLKRSGIQDVQYALITTQGGTVNIPSTLVAEDKINAQLGSLVIDGPKAEDGGAEAVKATARQVRWRPGVVRNIIHLPCRACDDGEAVSEALAENDVIYHILTKFKIVMNGPNDKKSKAMAAKVWGFDSKKLFTPKDAKKFAGNANLRKVFQDPEESSCMEAAQATGGSIYNINKWISKSAVAEKKYLGVVGQSVLKSSSSPACQECRCLGGDIGVSCRKCGAEWPVIETPDFQDENEIEGESDEEESSEEESSEEEAGEETADEAKSGIKKKKVNILSEIKKNFEEEFVQKNAALSHLEGDQEEDKAPKQETSEDQGASEGDENDEPESEEEYDDNYQYEY